MGFLFFAFVFCFVCFVVAAAAFLLFFLQPGLQTMAHVPMGLKQAMVFT